MTREEDSPKFRITSADALFHCAQHGKSVICPSVSYLEEPTKAKSFLNLSMKAVFKCLEKGLYLHEDGLEIPEHPEIQLPKETKEQKQTFEISILEHVQRKMRASGQSQAEMAQQTGVTQQRVSEFLQKKSLRSHLEKFAQIYAPEIYTNFNASEQ
jgi:predicted XRE-type DNA-binding protein